MADDKREQTSRGAVKKLFGAIALSLTWIICGWVVGSSYTPATTINEFGDFLAGLFAPAAFIMLFAAVWIQSDELREQRKELKLTRKEFEQNRTVMEQQASQAAKQAAFVAAQTDILLRAQADDEFKARLRLLQAFVTSTFEARFAPVRGGRLEHVRLSMNRL